MAAHAFGKSTLAFGGTRYSSAQRLAPSRCIVRCQQQGGGEGPVRRMVLMRHADSDQSRAVRDHDRPVTAQGVCEARQVAQQLREKGWVPEVVICSNSLRTRQTLEAMQEALPELLDADAHFLGSLYTTAALDGQTRSHLQEMVAAEASARHSCVLCLGHNKGWEEAAGEFSGQLVRLGNSHAALLQGAGGSWAEAFEQTEQWQLVGVLTPTSP